MVRFQKGHKNSKGEFAEWVIISHKTGKIISSHKTKKDAEKHLKDIQKFKHIGENMNLIKAKQILRENGYLTESVETETEALDQIKELVRVTNVLYDLIIAAIDSGYTIKRTNPQGYFLYNSTTKNVFAVNLYTNDSGIFINLNKNSYEERENIANPTVDKIYNWIKERD